MRNFAKGLLVGAGTLLLALLLNPGPDAHREKIKQAVAERSRIAGALQLGSVAAFVSSYHSLGVASYTRIDDRVLSWGALGFVHVPDFGAR
jgi:hypothetical protein